MTFKMPPLPSENFVDKDGLWDERFGPYSADEMRAYGRAVLEAVARRLDEEASSGRGAMHSVAAELHAAAKKQP